MNIKGAFDHVSGNQMLKICQKLQLLKSLCYWIKSFLQDRKMQLKYDGNSQEMTDIEIGIPQGSPISPILFLIYIRFLFAERKSSINERILSYLNDIGLVVSSKSIEENCQLLQKLTQDLLVKQQNNCMQFDMEKTELIHFHSKRSFDLKNETYSVKIRDSIIQPKDLVKWLGIWLDSKLTFKQHVEKKTTQALKILNQIERLSNIERGLSFQAMRQLYIACISSVADYGVPVWWNNQKNMLEKFQKLQNIALRKMLGAFKTSLINAMELEAFIPPPKVRFERICKNYAWRILQMHENHPIKLRVSSSFPPHLNGMKLNWEQFQDWNEKEIKNSQINYVHIDSGSDSSSRPSKRRRKRRKTRHKKKKKVSQLFNLTAKIADLLSSLKIEKIQHEENAPWIKNLNSLINIHISELNKQKEAIQHKELIQKLVKYQNINNIIIYSNGSKNEKINNLEAGIFYTTNFNIDNSESLSWNLGSNIEVFDAKLFAIEKAFKIAFERINKFTKNIWVFSDSQAAIQRLQNCNLKAGQKHVIAIKNWITKIKAKRQINIYINWIPAHMNIYGNEYADEAAKKGTKLQKISLEKYVSLAFIKRKIKESSLNEWQIEYEKSKKGRYYNQFESISKWKAFSKTLKKQTWSAYMQLKLGHGYFRFYLVRFSSYSSNRCFTCGIKEDPEHLILHCKNTKYIREGLKKEFDIKEFFLKNLFNTKIGKEFLFKLIEKT